MRPHSRWVFVVCCFAIGTGIGATRPGLPDIGTLRALPAREAGRAALTAAETLSDREPQDLLKIARAYFLAGDRPRARQLIARVEQRAPDLEQMRAIGLIYAEAGEATKADEYFRRVLAVDPRDEHALSQIGAALIRRGDREEGEALLARAFALDGKDERHYQRAAEAYLGVRATR